MARDSGRDDGPVYGGALPYRSQCVAQDINSEAKFQNDMLNQLQMALLKAQAGVKNNVSRLNKSIVHYGSSNVIPVVVFAFVCFFIVYM